MQLPGFVHTVAIIMEKASQPPAVPDLEASSPPPKPRESTIGHRWKQSIDPTNADLVCLLLCFLTGLCDSSAYNAWSCFLGMQTGMTHCSSDQSVCHVPSLILTLHLQ